MKYEWCRKAIARRHHIVIGGCSGSGKSTAEHDLLYTMMLEPCSEHCFVLIDTKRVELIDFKDAPHCARYCDNPDEVYPLLKNIEKIMDMRFERMQKQGQKVSSEPCCWVVIDEFYDIKTLCDKRCMAVLNRISSAGRAAKVLLIVGTQRTTRDTLSGMLSTNFSVKLGLRTITKQDSRNILQVGGCELLPKYGQGILQIDGINEDVVIPYTPEAKIRERIQYWIDLSKPKVNSEPPHSEPQTEPPKKKRWWQKQKTSQ